MKYTDPKGLIWGTQDFEQDGHKYRRYVWFKGDKVGKGFTAFTPAQDGTVIALKGGDAARLYRDGNYDYFPGPAKITITGQENLNASAGAFDGSVPFGKQIREWVLGGKGGVDSESREYKNASSISGGVQMGALLMIGAGEAELAEEGTTVLYRAVKQPELDDILESAAYRLAESQTEGKYFFETAEDATDFGQKMFGKFPQEGPYTVTSAEVDRAVIQASSPVKAAGEGPGRFIPANKLPIGPVKIGP